ATDTRGVPRRDTPVADARVSLVRPLALGERDSGTFAERPTRFRRRRASAIGRGAQRWVRARQRDQRTARVALRWHVPAADLADRSFQLRRRTTSGGLCAVVAEQGRPPRNPHDL